MQSSNMFPVHRFGDWNAKNRELLEETQKLGGNKYREKYLEATKEKQRTHWYKLTVYADEPEEVIELLKTYKGTGHIDKWKVEQSTRYYKYAEYRKYEPK